MMYFYLPGNQEFVFNLKGEVYSLKKPTIVVGYYDMTDNTYINCHGMVVDLETQMILAEPEDVIYIRKKDNKFPFDYQK